MEDLNANQLAMISQLMGGNADINQLNDMIKTANMINMMMSLNNNEETSDSKEIEVKERTTENHHIENLPQTAKERQIKALGEVIPYLDSRYQRGMYTALKFIEISRFSPSEGIRAMGADSNDEDARRIEIINTIDKYLTDDERKNVGIFLKLIKAGTFLK